MSTKRTKSDKSQREADALEKRLDDQPEDNDNEQIGREDSSRADVDGVRH
ncbi:MAG: hypothetical protein JO187_13545 [Acidobacteria bacterium]|nr:hypothetical protein [Acidobacteriota bacterium]